MTPASTSSTSKNRGFDRAADDGRLGLHVELELVDEQRPDGDVCGNFAAGVDQAPVPDLEPDLDAVQRQRARDVDGHVADEVPGLGDVAD